MKIGEMSGIFIGFKLMEQFRSFKDGELKDVLKKILKTLMQLIFMTILIL
jgi:hypothetical protein